MKLKIFFLHLLNLIVLVISLGTLACHIAQLTLLPNASSQQWWPHYIPYTFYYVGSIFSILSSTSLLLLTCIYSKPLWINRILSIINLLLTIAFIVYISLESGTIPWSKSTTSNQKGFAKYCSNYSDRLVYQRCWLSNGSWLGMIIYGFFWLLVAVYSWILSRQSDIERDNLDLYDFKQDIFMSDKYAVGPDLPHHMFFPSQDAYYYSSSGIPMHHTEYEYYNDDTGHYYRRPRRSSKTYLEEDNNNPSSSSHS